MDYEDKNINITINNNTFNYNISNNFNNSPFIHYNKNEKKN